MNRSRDSAPSFLKVKSFASVSYQVSLNSEILVEDLLSLLIMEKDQSSGVLCRVLDEREEEIIDREGNVFDPILSVCSVYVSKERLWWYRLQGNDVLNVCNSFLYYFAVKQTLPFP